MEQIMEITKIWNDLLEELAPVLSPASFETWLKTAKLIDIKEDTAIIGAPNTFAKEWLETRLMPTLKSTLSNLTGMDIGVKIIVDESLVEKEPARNQKIEERPSDGPKLNYRYTFDTFVVGSGNRMAHAAAFAVAENPGKAYNPLFIYGGVGLGKTHLMQAIGHHVIDKRKEMKVVYISSESFTNELINSIRDHTTVEFRGRYRSVDLLLIDDIQFLAGKETTQEEFFHTFNALYEAGKQIVISSDRPPKEIPTLEERLISRFEWGLTVDIQPPDLETRIAILRKKAELDMISVPDEVINLIAEKIVSNIRELEGALIKVIASASLTKRPITIELAEECLATLFHGGEIKHPATVEEIQKVVAEFYGVSIDEMKGKKRTKEAVFPRQVAMYIAREITNASLPSIGKEFGGRDHTTVIHSYEKIKVSMHQDPELAKTINQLLNKFIRG
jgi:chromosomal replication initiator protein